MDSSTLSECVREAFQREALRWNRAIVRNCSDRELVLSPAGLTALRATLSGEPTTAGAIEQAAFVQLLAFYLLDRGSLSPVMDYAVFLRDGPVSVHPSEVSIEITRLCNLRCLHCYNDSGKRDVDELGDDEKLALADYLGRWGVRRWNLTGGEPTLDPSFPALLSVGEQYGIAMEVTTNGWALPDCLLAAIEAGTVVQVNLSLDGADAVTHDTFRGRSGSYARVLSSMQTLARCRPRTLQLNASVHAVSLHQIQALITLALDNGFDCVSFKPVTASGRPDGRRGFLLSVADLRLFRAERTRLVALYAGRLHIEGCILGSDVPESILDRIYCDAAERSMVVLSNGKMTPCAVLNSDTRAPQISNMSPMQAWLTHPLFTSFRLMKARAGDSHLGCPGTPSGERRDIVLEVVQ